MLRTDCKVGMIVMFGRPNGEKTRGEVLAVNPAKAVVKTLEPRGQVVVRGPDQKWRVSYGLLTPAS